MKTVQDGHEKCFSDGLNRTEMFYRYNPQDMNQIRWVVPAVERCDRSRKSKTDRNLMKRSGDL